VFLIDVFLAGIVRGNPFSIDGVLVGVVLADLGLITVVLVGGVRATRTARCETDRCNQGDQKPPPKNSGTDTEIHRTLLPSGTCLLLVGEHDLYCRRRLKRRNIALEVLNLEYGGQLNEHTARRAGDAPVHITYVTVARL
jgi:hypothetical protein